MPLIDDSVAQQLTQEFQQLVNPVRLAVSSHALTDPGSEAVPRLVFERAVALGIKRSPAAAAGVVAG
jgi:hypothetical protein